MRQDKPQAFELRKQGKSYREIENLIGVCRSTLCEWFRDEAWSKHIKGLNNDKRNQISTEHLLKLNEGRRIMLEEKYKNTEEDAVQEYEIYKNDPLFSAGLMLYAGEGDKRTPGVIRLANTDFFIHKVFLKFIEKFTNIKMGSIRFSTLLYPDLNIEECRKKWSEELAIPLTNFHKPVIIQGRSQIRRLHFGVGSTIISNSFLKKKLLKWVEMSMIELST